jgi:lipopolysaccharide biosynthesis glycosyltransferase
MTKRSIYIGYDKRESDAFRVARLSLLMQSSLNIPALPIHLEAVRHQRLYSRDHENRWDKRTEQHQLYDTISQAPMSTEFALTRFLTPHLAKEGWALFMDCDFMACADIAELFALADPKYAVMVVKHDYQPAEGIKMDGQIQTAYPRKNWSSLMLFNCDHPANENLTLDMVNLAKGRELHNFCWLEDDEIGELPAEWNHLVGVDAPNPNAKMVHFTLGLPRMDGFAGCEHAYEWNWWRAKE